MNRILRRRVQTVELALNETCLSCTLHAFFDYTKQRRSEIYSAPALILRHEKVKANKTEYDQWKAFVSQTSTRLWQAIFVMYKPFYIEDLARVHFQNAGFDVQPLCGSQKKLCLNFFA